MDPVVSLWIRRQNRNRIRRIPTKNYSISYFVAQSLFLHLGISKLTLAIIDIYVLLSLVTSFQRITINLLVLVKIHKDGINS